MTDITTELFVDEVWQDISADVYNRNNVTINRGKADETGRVNAGRTTLTLDNRTGRYSPRNPTSDLFGKIGRNTPLRVRIGVRNPSPLSLPGLQTAYVFSSYDPVFDIAGDHDIRIDVEPDDWAGSSDPAVAVALVDGNWNFEIFNDGILRFTWGDGVSGDPRSASSTVGISQAQARQALRITIDVDNGAAGSDITFYTADTNAGPWTQLGATITQSVTSFFVPSNQDIEIGRDPRSPQIAGQPFAGILYSFQLLDAIDGTAVANPDFTDLDPDPTFTDTAGRTWTIVGASVTDPSLRFVGEVANWPQQWDASEADVFTQVEVAGLLRRLDQGDSPIGSTMFRELIGDTLPNVAPFVEPIVAYWPCEDGEGSTQIASGIPDFPPMSVNPAPDFGASDVFDASEPLPVITAENNSVWRGVVPNHVSPIPPASVVQASITFLFNIDEGVNDQAIMTVSLAGPDVGFIVLSYTTGGFLQMSIRDTEGVVLDTSSLSSETVNNKLAYLNIFYQQSATSDTFQYGLRARVVGEGSSTSGLSLLASAAVGDGGKVTRITVNPGGGLVSSSGRAVFGHIAVQVQETIFEHAQRVDALNAFVGEPAGVRIQRLSLAEDIPFTIIDDPTDTAPVGAQLPKTFLELIREAEVADQGILYESRDALRLAYRSRVGLYNQDPVLVLNYGDGVFGSVPTPVDDDQRTRNDITVTRQKGSSARLERTSGPLSIQAPPDGVGRYDDTVTVNLASDAQLANDVSWRLSLGTVDEARYPNLHANLIMPAYQNPTLAADAIAIDIGDRVVVNDPPDWLPPEQISVLAQGFTETLSLTTRDIITNSAPESPYRVGVYADAGEPAPPDAQQRYSSAGTVTIVEFVSGTDTALEVGTLIRPYWTTDSANMPFDILVSGVRLRVTAISAAVGDFQTMTVEQVPINGIVKTIPIVSVVVLFQPATYAL